jgi:hypothetical protein
VKAMIYDWANGRLRLAMGDVAVLVLFGLAGLASHERALTAETLGRSVLPFVVSWLVLASLLGAYRDDVADRIRGALLWVPPVWLLAGVTALAARSVIFDRPLFSAFFVIGLVGNGVLLVAWRTAWAAWLSSGEDGRPRERMHRGEVA